MAICIDRTNKLIFHLSDTTARACMPYYNKVWSFYAYYRGANPTYYEEESKNIKSVLTKCIAAASVAGARTKDLVV